MKLRLLFADDGEFHHETIQISEAALDGYERLIDALRESPEILKSTFIDVDRLVSASVAGSDD